MKLSFLIVALATLTLIACEGKKSLDGHPMDKPPPSADTPRDSEPNFDTLDSAPANTDATSAPVLAPAH